MDDKHVTEIYDFARAHGYNINKFTTADRHNKHGAYSYVEMALIIPREAKPRPFDKQIAELEAEVEEDNTSAESAERKEVVNNEV